MNDEFLCSRSFDKFEQGDYRGALEDLEYALQINPNSASAYYIRGFMLGKLGNTDRALADLSESIRLN